MTSGINKKKPISILRQYSNKKTHYNRCFSEKRNKNTIFSCRVRLFKIKFKRKTLDYCYYLSDEG